MSVAALVEPAMARLTIVMASAPPSVPPSNSDPSSGKGPEWGEAAPIGLLIWLLMGLALFLLIKSMNRNLRKVPASFDEEPTAPPDRTDGGGAEPEATSAADGGAGPRGETSPPGDSPGSTARGARGSQPRHT